MTPVETIVPVLVFTDADGVVRIPGTRVTLETIVGAFDAGATPEELAQQYASVPLKDIYAVIAHCRQHEPEVRAYRQHREQLAVAVRGEAERRFSGFENSGAVPGPTGFDDWVSRQPSRAGSGHWAC